MLKYDVECCCFAAEQRRNEGPMVTARFLRAAGACLTMCPVVMCGGERGDGRALAAVSFNLLFVVVYQDSFIAFALFFGVGGGGRVIPGDTVSCR